MWLGMVWEFSGMSVIRVKDGVQFAIIAPGGFRILSALDQVAAAMPFDLTITSGTDGVHSGLADPHHKGCAYDVRSHDLTPEQKQQVIDGVMKILGFERFFGFIEALGTDNEHIHLQVKRDTVYP